MILKPPVGALPNIRHLPGKIMAGCWLFNDAIPGELGTVHDVSGNANHGVCSGNAHGVPGLFGRVLALDNNHDFAEIASPGSLFDGQVISIVAWIKPNDSANSHPRIIDRTYDGQFAFHYDDTPDDHDLGFSCVTDIGGEFDSTTVVDACINFGKWQQVAVTMDGINIRGYHNGILGGTLAHAGVLVANDTIMRIGERADDAGREFEGYIDHIIIYIGTLSDGDVNFLYRNPFHAFDHDPIELWSAATLGIPPVGNAGIMTTWGGFWGPTY